MEKYSDPTVRDLYPHLSGKDFAEAQDNLERYLSLMLRVFERLDNEMGPQASQLTPDAGTLPCTPPTSGASE